MADFDDLVSALRWLFNEQLAHNRQYIRGLLGNGAGKVAVPDRPDYNYVRPSRGSSVVWEVFNKTVSGPDGWPVLVGELPWQPGMVQVVSTDYSAYRDKEWGEAIAPLPRHAKQHEWPDTRPGPDPMRVFRRSLEDLKTWPIGSGSQTVYLSPFDYTHGIPKTWPGFPGIDLAGAAPSTTGSARLMLTYLDPVTNTIGAWSGTVGAFGETTILNRPALPTGSWIPSAYVRLYFGQTTVSERDIWDARPLFQSSSTTGTASSYPPSGPASGDLTGTYPNPLVAGLYGYPYGLETPSEGEVLMYSGSAWRPIGLGGATGPASGDLTGTYPNPTVRALLQRPMALDLPGSGDVLTYSGSAWRPMTPTGGAPSGAAGGDLTGTYPNPLVAGLYGYPYGLETPSEGDVLMYSGSAWRAVPGVGSVSGWKMSNTPVVSSSGDGDYANIGDALSGAASGTFVWVDGGVYTEDVVIPQGVTLFGVDRDAVIIRNNLDSFTVRMGDGAQLANLTVDNYATTGTVASVYVPPTSPNTMLTNVRARQLAAGASARVGFLFSGTSGALIDCLGDTTAGGYSVQVGSGCLLRVYGGIYADAAFNIGDLYMFGMPRIVSITGIGDLYGVYQDQGGTAHYRTIFLDGNPDALVLDAAGTSSISAETNNQIDFEIGSTDRVSMTETGITVVERVVEAAWHDVRLYDTVNALGLTDHYRQNAATYPAGWTEVDAPTQTNTDVAYSFWTINGTSTDTSWEYKQQSSINMESGGYTWVSVQWGPVMMRSGAFSADVDYYLGLYQDSGGIVTTRYVRAHIWWDSANQLWKVRGEESDGAVSHTGSWITLDQNPLRPLYLRCAAYYTGTKLVRVYLGDNYLTTTQALIMSQTPTTPFTWGVFWVRLHQSRGAGVSDTLYLGSLDFTESA